MLRRCSWTQGTLPMTQIRFLSKSRLLVLLIHVLVFIPAASAQGRLPEADYFSLTPAEWDAFGYQVVEYNDRLLISAPAFDSQVSGMVYLFDKNTKEIVHVFHPDDDVVESRLYGVNIAISDDCIVISAASGSADSLVFVHDPVTFELIATIELSSDKVSYSLGISMDLDGADLLIGLPFSDVHGLSAGQALLYHAPTAMLLQEITRSEYGGGGFGSSVQINDKHIVVTATGIKPNGRDYGAVYLFDRDNGQQLNMLVDNQVTDDNTSFGYSVRLEQNTLAVSRSVFDITDINNQVYSIQLFDITDPSDQTPSYSVIEMPETIYNLQRFGVAIALNDQYIVLNGQTGLGHLDWTMGIFVYDLQSLSLIEVIRTDRVFQAEVYISPVLDYTDQLFFGHMASGIEGPTGPGIVHQYQLTDCPQDINHDGSLDTEDINQFIQARMDWNDTLSFNYFDISAFIEGFLAGCP